MFFVYVAWFSLGNRDWFLWKMKFKVRYLDNELMLGLDLISVA